MKNVKQTVLNLLAKAGMRSAIKAAGSASCFGYHQVAEPKSVKNFKK